MTVLTGHATSLNVSKLCVGSKPILFYKNPAKKIRIDVAMVTATPFIHIVCPKRGFKCHL